MPLDDVPMEQSVYDQPSGIAAYDPETVQPTRNSPAPSSDTAPGDAGGTSGKDGEQAPEDEEQPEEPLPKFDPRYVEEFRGLIYVGALTDTFTWLGHRFVIRTLTTGELAEVALAVKVYDGSDAVMKVYQAAVVAACVTSVDGQPMPIPLTNGADDTSFINKFNYVMRCWFPPVLDVVYERYYGLEIKVRQVIAAMGNPTG